jgi:NAD-dependent dihydropyrimidine dehydrogenase PreA subunit
LAAGIGLKRELRRSLEFILPLSRNTIAVVIDLRILFCLGIDKESMNQTLVSNPIRALWWQYVIAVLSCLMASAHFLRGGQLGLVAVCLLAPMVLISRKRWGLRALQLFLVILTVEWFRTAWQLSALRLTLGQPVGRMLLILGIVAGLTISGGAALQTRRVLSRHSLGLQTVAVSFGAFLLSVTILALVHVGVSRPMLLAERFFPGWGALEILALGVWAAWLGERMFDPKAAPRWRLWLWTLFSIVFFAQLTIGLAGAERFLQTGTLHLPIPALIVAGPAYRGEGFFMLVLFLATILFVGPAWCSHLCYFGVWDQRAAQTKPRPLKIPRPNALWRVAMLVLLIAVSVFLRFLGAASVIAVSLAVMFGLLGIAIMATWSRHRGVMMHCTAWCPIGLLATRLGRLNPFRIRIAEDACTSCMACGPICRFGALTAADIQARHPGPDCTLCGDCISPCTKSAIAYYFPGLSQTGARTFFLVLVLGFHAVFLGLARI